MLIKGLGLGVGLSVLYVKYLHTGVPEAVLVDSSDSDSAGEELLVHKKRDS
jgi:hypothetical protein